MEETNEKILKKPSVLSSSMFNFIANMVSGNTIATGIESTNSQENAEDNSASNIKNQKEATILASHLHTELTIDSGGSDREDARAVLNQNVATTLESAFEFKHLSSATKEYMNGNFLKGCKWSPDGTCIITNSNDSILRIYDTTTDMMNDENKENVEIVCCLKLEEPEIIYDYAWYPFMDSSNPTSACVFSSCKDNPIHLFDAYTGHVRCSYKGYNHLDELVSAYSIAFDPDCAKLYCGYNKCIKVFDISRPGRNYNEISTNKGEYKLPGIVSCITFSPVQTEIFAVGSYSKYIGIYSAHTNEPLCLIESHIGGLTHMRFSDDGNRLYSGARKDSDIICWDIRNFGKVLQVFKRNVQTNQRVYFDLHSKYLVSGSNDGMVNIWNSEEFNADQEYQSLLASFKASEDCVNGVSFNPVYPLLATASGQRKFFEAPKRKRTKLECDYDLISSSESSGDEDFKKCEENSLKIWKHTI